MNDVFVRGPVTFVILLVSALLAVFPLSATRVEAGIYDDFTNSGISTTLWSTANAAGFTQPGDGYLHYQDTSAHKGTLLSTAAYTSGIFTMPFIGYSSDNIAPGAQGLGSVAALGLGSRSINNWVRIERGQVQGDPAHGITGGYVEVNWVQPSDPNHVYVNWLQSDITSGFFQLRYDGVQVTSFYRGLDSDPWTQIMITNTQGNPVLDANNHTQPLVLTPGWGAAVPMFIQGVPGGNPSDNYTLSFQVDRIEVVPLPPSLLLLVPGLIGLAAVRSRVKK